MNKELWEKIAAFDFDNPFSEYGFYIVAALAPVAAAPVVRSCGSSCGSCGGD